MQTSPSTNSIHSSIQCAAKSQSKVHTTTLEYLMRTFPQYDPDMIETIHPHLKSPWWTPPFINIVNGDKSQLRNIMMKQFMAQIPFVSTQIDPSLKVTLEQQPTALQHQLQNTNA